MCIRDRRSAARYQVRGYIRNLADGRVEALVEGSEKAVNSFRADLAAGPINARVGPIEELVLDPCGLYSAFRIEK